MVRAVVRVRVKVGVTVRVRVGVKEGTVGFGLGSVLGGARVRLGLGLGGAHLVEKVLEVLVGQRLLAVYDVVQVGIHQLRHNIHVLPVLLVPRGRQDIEQPEHLHREKQAASGLGARLLLRRLLSAPEEGLQYRGSGRPRPISRCAALAGHASAVLSTQPSTLSCLKWRRILISRSSRLQSIVSSNAFGIFLIATLFPVSVFEPEHTRP